MKRLFQIAYTNDKIVSQEEQRTRKRIKNIRDRDWRVAAIEFTILQNSCFGVRDRVG